MNNRTCGKTSLLIKENRLYLFVWDVPPLCVAIPEAAAMINSRRRFRKFVSPTEPIKLINKNDIPTQNFFFFFFSSENCSSTTAAIFGWRRASPQHAPYRVPRSTWLKHVCMGESICWIRNVANMAWRCMGMIRYTSQTHGSFWWTKNIILFGNQSMADHSSVHSECYNYALCSIAQV